MRTLGEAYAHLCAALEPGEARAVLERRAGAAWADIIARPDAPVPQAARALIARDLERRQAGEPLGRIYGEREFWGMAFRISPDTLEPRPDTEALVALALAGPEPARILDLGTGSGCILLALLKAWPRATGVGLDIAPGALATARENARAHGLAGRAHFACGNWADAIRGRFDLLVSNPPYIRSGEIAALAPEVRDHDPRAALDGGNTGLAAYRAICVDIPRLLAPGGRGLLEIGYDQGPDLIPLARAAGLRAAGVHRDLGGRDRVVEIYHGDKS